MFERPRNSIDAVAFVSGDRSRISWHSAESLHASRSNQWKDWFCSAGIRTLYVNFDGEIFVGTCAVGGSFGNVYALGSAPTRPMNRWIRCTANSCQCGFDMQTPKVRSEASIPEDFDSLFQDTGARAVPLVADAEYVLSETPRHTKLICWEIGRRCNYDCSYCFPEAHSSNEPHKDLATLKRAVDFIKTRWAPGSRVKFVIQGGEPTANPDYLELVKYIKASPQADIIHTTTNGSRNAAYYSELIGLSDIIFSAHLEYLENPRAYAAFLANVRACIEKKRADPDSLARFHWLSVRIMMPPGAVALAQRLWDEVWAIPDFGVYAAASVSLLHDKENKDRQLSYSPEEIEFVKKRA